MIFAIHVGGSAAMRQRTHLTTIVLPCLILAALLISSIQAAEPEQFKATVRRVLDGDTLDLNTRPMSRVRAFGIDAPEANQPYGTEATLLAHKLLDNERVTVTVHGRDKYGRVVGSILIPSGKDYGQEMVKAGAAWWAKQYAKDDAVLQRLQAEAQSAKRGLWYQSDPVAPWDWRSQHPKVVRHRRLGFFR
jgi:endonuclease YncB( thermonuclease family)